MKALKSFASKSLDVLFPSLIYGKISYSQDGEDMLLKSFYEQKKNYKGFYIDVGAHHPVRFSATYHFYRKGWNGINIEPTPSSFYKIQNARKRDINLNIAISDRQQKLTFYLFNEPALNTFDEALAKFRDGLKNYRIINQLEIPCYTLKDILYLHLPQNQKIDFLNVDAEGMDLSVLKSNDWNLYRPKFILAENQIDFDNFHSNEISKFLTGVDYLLAGQTKRTSLFINSREM